MNAPDESQEKPSLIRRILRFIVRLVFVVLLGILLGGFLFYTVPVVYREYILPLQEYGVRLDALEAQQEIIDQQTDDQIESMQERLQFLEAQGDVYKQDIAELQDRMSDIKEAAATQEAAYESLQTLSEEFDSSQGRQAEMGRQLDVLVESQRRQQAAFRDIQQLLANLETELDQKASLWDEVAQALEQEDGRWAAMEMEIQKLKAMELLTRSRLHLSQNNLGMAQTNTQAARDLIAALQEDATGEQAQAFAGILSYLDAALEALPLSPLLAADSLESAWLLVIQVQPSATPTPTSRQTEVIPLPTATPIATLTPTP